MTARWSAFEDASTVRAEHDADALNEVYGNKDDWADDDRPTRVELADSDFDWRGEQLRGWMDNR